MDPLDAPITEWEESPWRAYVEALRSGNINRVIDASPMGSPMTRKVQQSSRIYGLIMALRRLGKDLRRPEHNPVELGELEPIPK